MTIDEMLLAGQSAFLDLVFGPVAEGVSLIEGPATPSGFPDRVQTTGTQPSQ